MRRKSYSLHFTSSIDIKWAIPCWALCHRAHARSHSMCVWFFFCLCWFRNPISTSNRIRFKSRSFNISIHPSIHLSRSCLCNITKQSHNEGWRDKATHVCVSSILGHLGFGLNNIIYRWYGMIYIIHWAETLLTIDSVNLSYPANIWCIHVHNRLSIKCVRAFVNHSRKTVQWKWCVYHLKLADCLTSISIEQHRNSIFKFIHLPYENRFNMHGRAKAHSLHSIWLFHSGLWINNDIKIIVAGIFRGDEEKEKKPKLFKKKKEHNHSNLSE